MRTLTTLEALQDDLARIRRRGYATDNEEHELGVACVATPVFDHNGLPLAAISVSGPTTRILHADTADLAGLLREHATDVARALGYAWGDASALAARSWLGRSDDRGGAEGLPRLPYSATGSTEITRPLRPSRKATTPAAFA